MNDRRDLWLIVSDLFVFVPFSLVGAIFGDTMRKDALTRRQRGAAGLFSMVTGPLLGLVVITEFGWADWSGLVVASAWPTLSYDVIMLAGAITQQSREDPRGWFVILRDTLISGLQALLPWRK